MLNNTVCTKTLPVSNISSTGHIKQLSLMHDVTYQIYLHHHLFAQLYNSVNMYIDEQRKAGQQCLV